MVASAPNARTFRLEIPLIAFEKADAPEGQRRRIAGIASTDRTDRQGEQIIQHGLDWSPLMNGGRINLEHSKSPTDIIGVPKDVLFFKKGDRLPNGQTMPSNGHWLEACLLEDDKLADTIWHKQVSLQKAGAPGFKYSIEGDVLQRAGADGKIVARATVRHTAVTDTPVNPDCAFEALVKSMSALEAGELDDDAQEIATETRERAAIAKLVGLRAEHRSVMERIAMDPSMMPATRCELLMHLRDEEDEIIREIAAADAAEPVGGAEKALTAGSPSGRALGRQDLEGQLKKPMNKSEGLLHLAKRLPGTTFHMLERIYDSTAALAVAGRI